jgi:hypothetical protein
MKTAENSGFDGCNDPATPTQQPCSQQAVTVADSTPRPPRRKGRVSSADPLEQAVLDRVYEAGDVIRRLPGTGTSEGDGERMFEFPQGAEIDRMDEVICEWVFLLATPELLRIFKWVESGVSLRKAAERDPHRRSPEGIRKAILGLATHLGRLLAKKWGIGCGEELTNRIKRR